MINIDIKLASLFVGTAILIVVFLWLLLRKKSIGKLIVVGNGFDLYHGIQSSYLRFRDFVKKNDPDVYTALEKYLYLQGDNEWNQFEKNMANLDADELLDEMRMYLGDQGGDWKDSMYHEFQYETGRVTEMLGEKMKQLFLKWILQLDIKHNSNSPRLLMPKNQLYLNFNYTKSLEKLYAISDKNIFYIHGRALDENSQIVLGHGWGNYEKATDPKEITYEDFVDGDYATEEDWQYTEAKGYIINYFRDNYKNAPAIIKKNKGFFKKLRRIKEIYVMGHSMTEVDWKYFEAISSNIKADKVKWTISYYKKDDIENCKKTLELAGIDLNLVRFKKLEDFFSNQGELFDH
jgi:Bacteriophage abortive infection AbiH